MKKIFINLEENRLRAGWRILIFIIFFVAIAYGFSRIIKLFLNPELADDNLYSNLVEGGLIVISASLAVLIVRKFIDKRSFTSLGLKLNKTGLADLVFGFILSGVMIGFVSIILSFSGMLRFESIELINTNFHPIIEVILWLIAIGVFVGWAEELMFRGYLLQNLADGIGVFWAVILSSLIFGFLHLNNEHATLVSGLLITVLSFVLVLGWLRTKQIWLPIGIHAGWNFFLGPIFGFPVSGNATPSIINQSVYGPVWFTGGDFGPEGGIVSLCAILFGIIFLQVYTKKRRHIQFQLPRFLTSRRK